MFLLIGILKPAMDWGVSFLVPWLSNLLLPPVSGSFVPSLLKKKKKKESLSHLLICCVDVGDGKHTCWVHVWMLQSILSFLLHGSWGYNSRQHEPLSADQHAPSAAFKDLSHGIWCARGNLEQSPFSSHFISKHPSICKVLSHQSLNQYLMKKNKCKGGHLGDIFRILPTTLPTSYSHKQQK